MNTSTATATSMAYVERLSLRPGVHLVSDERRLHLVRIGFAPHSQSIGATSAMKRAVLAGLAEGPRTPAEVRAIGTAAGGDADDVSTFLGVLRARGWLVVTVHRAGRVLYSVQPVRAPARPRPASVEDPVLSRFTVLRAEGRHMVVESPLASARIEVHDADVVALIGGLALGAVTTDRPCTPSLPATLADRVLVDLCDAGLVVARAAESGPDVAQWRPHELWFHARSRIDDGGYDGGGFGRTHWARGTYEPLPVRRGPAPGPVVDLYRPDLAALRVTDPPLTAVVEDRRSVRVHDDARPVTVDQLAELLYRCARARTAVAPDGVEFAGRPHPSGGSAYELELYPVVHRVSGLDPGMYRYDPHDHRLALVRAPGPHVTRLLRTAAQSAAMSAPPQVLIVVTARFGRLMQVYENLSYALILKHIGVLYQTMYLVATSMGLAACGLGAGDAGAFTTATGLDYLHESSVGEFILGSRLPQPEGEVGGPAVAP